MIHVHVFLLIYPLLFNSSTALWGILEKIGNNNVVEIKNVDKKGRCTGIVLIYSTGMNTVLSTECTGTPYDDDMQHRLYDVRKIDYCKKKTLNYNALLTSTCADTVPVLSSTHH